MRRKSKMAAEQPAELQTVSDGLRLRWAGWLLDQLERRGMLVADAPRPTQWCDRDLIDCGDFSQWLRKHMNVDGWRAIMGQVQQHNEADQEHPWDLASPRHLLDAVEAALKSKPLPIPVRSTALTTQGKEDFVAEIQERDNSLKSLRNLLSTQLSEQEAPQLSGSAWLLSPRAAAAVVRAQATNAKAVAELERARSEALLHALRVMETNLRSSAMLAQIEDLRRRLGPHLSAYCREHNIPVPPSGSAEEANLLFLLNAQLSALNDAQDEIARRGAALARDQIGMAERNAKATMEARTLPLRLEAEMQANPIREKLLREQMRHKSASWAARIVGGLGGTFIGLSSALVDTMTNAIVETAWISGPALFVFFLTLVAQTLSYSGPLSVDRVIGFAGIALWNGLLMLGLTLVGFAFWRYLNSHYLHYGADDQEGDLSEADALDPDLSQSAKRQAS